MYMTYKPNTADACYYEMKRHEAKLATNICIAQLNLFLQSYRTLLDIVTVQMYCDMSKI